jgi:hypothetical protein
MNPREILEPFDEATLIKFAATRLLDLMATDAPTTHLMEEIITRRGADAFSTDADNLAVCAVAQLDILACLGKVMGIIADGGIPTDEDWQPPAL